jgi:hypothetical protein
VTASYGKKASFSTIRLRFSIFSFCFQSGATGHAQLANDSARMDCSNRGFQVNLRVLKRDGGVPTLTLKRLTVGPSAAAREKSGCCQWSARNVSRIGSNEEILSPHWNFGFDSIFFGLFADHRVGQLLRFQPQLEQYSGPEQR